uniref:hypothetical protein n=1 Tax=uncultured Paraglaciecola sp. TaxID=1765024 RepID=UPI0025DEEEE7
YRNIANTQCKLDYYNCGTGAAKLKTHLLWAEWPANGSCLDDLSATMPTQITSGIPSSFRTFSFSFYFYLSFSNESCLEDELMTHSLRADSPRATAMMHSTSGIPSCFRPLLFSFYFYFSQARPANEKVRKQLCISV